MRNVAFELTLAGFQGNGETADENKVKWVLAPSIGAVHLFCRNMELKAGYDLQQMSNQAVDFDDGVDILIDHVGAILAQSPTTYPEDWANE